MAEQLQLDGLKDAALAALRAQHHLDFQTQMQAKRLDADLAQLSATTLIKVFHTFASGTCKCGCGFRFIDNGLCSCGRRKCYRCNRCK